jgi:predicted kinase
MVMSEEISNLLKQYLYIPVGLPGCGKSTFFQTMRDSKDFFPVKLASPDVIREEYYPGYEAGEIPFEEIDQEMAFLESERRMQDYLIDGFDVWYDATNLLYKSRMVLYHLGEAINFKPMCSRIIHYVLIKMNVPLEIIKERACGCGNRKPPIDRLERMQRQFESNQNLHFPERSEIWDLEWNSEWTILNDVPEKCKNLVNTINQQFKEEN